MKKLLWSLVALVAAAGQAWAAPPADTAGTIKMYQRTNASTMAVTNAAIARFNARYPNVKVETQWLLLGTWGEYISGFLNQVASGKTPDIYEVAIEGFSSIASKGLLLPLDEVIAKDAGAKELLADIEPNLLKGMSDATGGKLYFFPTSWNNVLTFYNKDLFDQAGLPYPKQDWTWDDFVKTAKALTRQDASGKTAQFGYFVPGTNFTIAPWLLTNDTDKLKGSWTESNAKDPKFKEAMQFLHDLIHVHKAAPNFEKVVGDAPFVAKQVAMLSAGHWPVPTIVGAGMKNVGVVLMPRKRSDATVFGVGGLGILKAPKNPALVWELVKELTGPAAQKMYADTNRNVPSLRPVATNADWVKFPENALHFYASAATAKPIASPSSFAEVEEIFMRNVELYLSNNTKLDQMIDTLDSELARAMRRAR